MDSCMTELENRQRRQRHKIPRMNRMYCTTRRLKILPGHLMVCLSGLKHFPWRCHGNLAKSAKGPASLISGKHASCGSPFRHGPQAVDVGGKRSLVRPGRNEQVPDSGKDRGEPLQTSDRPEALHYPLSQRDM